MASRGLLPVCSALLAWAAGPAAHAAGPELFPDAPIGITSAASGARAVAVGDLDGDGWVDVLSASYVDGRIAWYRNGGQGRLWSAHTLSREAPGATRVEAADLDADGDLDVLCTAQGDDAIFWLRNEGGAREWTRHEISRRVRDAQVVAVGDIDADGDLDVISTSERGQIAWYENPGADGAWATHPLPGRFGDVREIVALDVDGDGDADLAVAALQRHAVVWLENRAGDGTAWVERDVGGPLAAPATLAHGDLDGDGRVDLIVAGAGDGRLTWLRNATLRRQPSFRPGAALPAQLPAPSDLHVDDVDGDGDLDVISASYADDRVTWFENVDGAAGRWHARAISIRVNGAVALAAADVDGDGDLDVVSAADLDSEIAWHENRGPAARSWRAHAITTAARGARSVVGVDVDGDGDIDVVSASTNDDKIAWYENTLGDGTLWVERVITLAANGAFSVWAGDVDGDGDADVLAASSFDDRIVCHVNLDGRGTRWDSRLVSANAGGASAVFGADVDGDGDVDVLAASDFDAKVAWHENLGGATRWRERVISTSASGATSVYAADLDGDGRLDVLSASRFDHRIAWYRNVSGDGSAWREHEISDRARGATSVCAADIDGDGDVDVLSSSRGDDGIAWYENVRGDGSVLRASMISSDSDGPTQVVAADVDGDGDLDVLGASRFDDGVRWFENRSSDGRSWTPWRVTSRARGATGVWAGDVDGDGRVDVISSSAGDDKLAWYRNRAPEVVAP